LNTIEKPDWLFQNIQEYLDKVKQRTENCPSHQYFLLLNLFSTRQILLDRYKLDSSINQSQTKVRFIECAIDFDLRNSKIWKESEVKYKSLFEEIIMEIEKSQEDILDILKEEMSIKILNSSIN